MTRTSLKGVAKVRSKLADGTVKEYFYAWRGGPLIKGKDGRALKPHEPEFAIAYAEAHKVASYAPAEILRSVVREFQLSSEYSSKAGKTRRAYDSYLREIDEVFGGLDLAAIQDQRMRGKFKSWRDTMAATPRKADYAWTTLARLLSWAKDRGRIAVNVCERGGRLYAADRSEKIWEEDHVASLLAVAGQDMRLALMLALWTGQRQGDLLRAKWSDYDGKTLRVRQGKTGARVAIPVGDVLRVALNATPRRSTTILTNSKGQAWTEDGFRASWRKTCEKAGISGLTFHDLRGTCVTRLALAGCTVTEIAAVTGHSLKDVDRILDVHYLGGREELARRAIAKLEAAEETEE